MKTKSRFIPAALALVALSPLAFSQAGAATTSMGDGLRTTGEGVTDAGQGLLHLPGPHRQRPQ